MRKKKEIKFSEHILLNKSRLSELNELLIKHSDSISYNAETRDKSKIKFDSIDELLDYDNCNKGKIVSLTAYCWSEKNWSHTIVLYVPSLRGKETVSLEYEFTSIDEESVFSAEIEKLIKKSTEYDKTYIATNWILCFALLACGFTKIASEYKEGLSADVLRNNFILYEGAAVFLYWLISHFIIDRLFPRVVFLIGEEVGQYEYLKKMRGFLLGSIIGGLVIGLFVNYLSKRLWG